MSHSLTEIAEQLRDANKKVQLIYAFNGTGKTRLSREFKELIDPKNGDDETPEERRSKVLYYNAFTEDLFYWDNDSESKLKIQPNDYTDWVLQVQGQDKNAIAHFQRYTNDKLTPRFNEEYKIKTKDKDGIEEYKPIKAYSEVSFSYERGNDTIDENIKISKGEESCFIWSIFYSLIEQVVDVLNVAEPDDRETDQFDLLEYIFIDDPVSSLDENHLIELAVDIAELIKRCKHDLKFIITTHNPLLYNILCNELGSDEKFSKWKSKNFQKYRLVKHADASFNLMDQPNDSPFSYHLYLKSELERVVENMNYDKDTPQKYHFNFLRNILEKTSTFVGCKRWEELLPSSDDGRSNPYLKRILNLSSHSKHSGDETPELTDEDKKVLGFLVKKLDDMYRMKMRNE
jgi:wobble nucleotide-excising tRNase